MYKPQHSRTLAEVTEQQIRLGIQGYPKTGKTYSAMTFPNPVVINFDRGLGAFTGRSDIIEIPFYDDSFCRSINPNHKDKFMLRNTLLIWLRDEAIKLEPDQTLVWDGGTGTQNCYHAWYSKNTVTTQGGRENDFAEWRLKIQFFADICETFKSLKCHVIYITHEVDKPDKKMDIQGEYSGKIRPLLTGQFANELASHFTDWFRQNTKEKILNLEKIKQEDLQDWGVTTKEEYLQLMSQFPDRTIYYWQTQGDNYFDGGCSSLLHFPRFIPSNYNEFKKYMKISQS